MRKLFTALACAAVCLGAPAQAADAKDAPKPAASLEELDKRLTDTFAKGKVPGASIVIIEGNQIVFTKGYGFADLKAKKPVTPDTVFRAGSVSKSFTAIGIMMLVEEGKLSLDTKLADLMPELKFDNAWETTDPVRLVHLLEHTTGFNDISFRHYLLEGKDVPLSKAVDMYGPYKSRWKPGTRPSYCNAGPVIAGRIIEKVSGQTFPEFMAARLTGPLAMESAYWTREPQITDRLSKSYADSEGTEEPFVEILARPSGSLNVTPKDLARLPLLMLGRGTLDGRTYLTPATVERIEHPQTTYAARAGLKYGYGLGNTVSAGKRAIFQGHDGAIDGFAARYEYAPAHGLGYVVMANIGNAQVRDAGTEIKDYLERNLPEVKPAAQPLAAADAERWSGFYVNATPRQQVMAMLESMFAWFEVKPDGGGLNFATATRIHLGNGIFQRTDRAAPGSVFMETPEGTFIGTPVGTDRKMPLWEVGAKLAGAAAVALALALSALYMLLWIPSAFLGRLAERGGITIRFMPWLAIVTLVAFAITTVMVMSSGDLNIVGKPSTGAWAIYALTLAVPATGALSLLRAIMGAADANIFVRGLAWLNSLAVLAFAGYMWLYDWIGMKLWE